MRVYSAAPQSNYSGFQGNRHSPLVQAVTRKWAWVMTGDDSHMKTMPSPLLSVRLPQELMNEIASAAIGGNKSQVVIDILTAHFNPASEYEVGQLRRRLEVVEQDWLRWELKADRCDHFGVGA